MSDPIVNALADGATETQRFRSQVGHISRQSGIFFAGTIFTAAFGYVFKVYLARVLGAEALGIYALGMTVAGLAGVLGGLGLTWAASRFPPIYCSANRVEELRAFLVWSVAILVAVNGLLALGVVFARHWISTTLYHTPALSTYLHFFAAIMFFGALTTFFAQLLTGYKEVAKRTIITNIGGSLLTMLLTVMLVETGGGLRGYILAQIASTVVVLILLMWVAHRLTPRAARFSLRPIRFPRGMFSFASAAFAMDVVGFLYTQTDKVILGFYLNARSVGIYAVAATIVAFLAIALQSVNQIFSPTIADLHARGEAGLLNRLYQILTKWIFGLTLPLAAVVIVFSRVLMRVFGSDFEVGWVILVIGAAGQLVNCAVGSVGYILLMAGHEKRLVWVQLVTALVTVTCCLLLVPRWGIAGAAVAAAVGNAGSNIWCLLEVRRLLGFFPYNRSYSGLVLPAIVSIAAAIALRVALQSVRPDIVAVVVATIAVYVAFAGAVAVTGLESDDRLIAGAIWARIRNLIPGSSAGPA